MSSNMGKFWKISPGDRGKHWNKWSALGIAAVGFSAGGRIGELDQYDSLEELVQKYHALGFERIHQSARQLWRFARDVQVGDFLVAYKLYHLLDVGLVTGECTFEWDELSGNERLYCYRRPVQWLGLESHEITGEVSRAFMSRNLTIFLLGDENTVQQVRNLLESVNNIGQLPKKFRKSLNETPNASDNKKPTRVKTETYRILRDTKKSRAMKKVYDHKCQICGARINIPGSGYYSEVHHIRPLGGNHSGPDDYSNMLCLCPWHHAEMDYGVFYIAPESLTIVHSNPRNRYHNRAIRMRPDHGIDKAHLKYHRDVVCSV